MIADLYQRAYTTLHPTVDCYCGVRVVEERVRKTVPGEEAYRYGVWITQRYDTSNGEPHFCSTENLARALRRNQSAARSVWYRMSEQPRRKKR